MSALSAVSDISYLSGNEAEIVMISNQLINSEYTEFTIILPDTSAQELHSATVNMQFKPEKTQNIFIGPKNIISNEFNYYPIYNLSLENLDWTRVSNDQYTLWQRESVYASIGDFLQDPPGLTIPDLSDETSAQLQIADYYSNFDQSPIVQKHIRSKDNLTANTSTPFIEGSLTSYIFATKKGTVSIKIDKYDNNYYPGKDIAEIFIYDGANNLIHQDTITDDGVDTAGGPLGPPQSTTITFDSDHADLYKIKIVAKDSFVKMHVNQPFLVIENTLVLRDDIINPTGTPIQIFTDATDLSILKWHIDGTNQTLIINDEQTITLDSSRMQVTNTRITIYNRREINKIQLEKNHLGLQIPNPEIKRYFSFSADSFFNPTPLKLRDLDVKNDLSESSTINYIISKYHSPELVNSDYYQSNIQFDLSEQNYIDQNEITFSIYTPLIGSAKNNFKIFSLDLFFEK